ncbi:hypothetical protein [Acinetobacter haemolyticus]|uniref:hypothetical protein n=1 Tax=Acinetobacter haemolyticus TaxID=29430 RepID=UPI000D693DDC|nr:hypothetical protein [Acinetobacter haemolyticus]
MLEQLQRLQAHIGVLKTRLSHLERENNSLSEAKQLAATDHHAQIVQKNSIITQKQDEVDNLTEQLTQLQDQFKQLNNDATALAERYSRLEKSTTDLKNRFQEILAERNDLRVIKEKLQAQQRNNIQEIQDLQQDRDRLLQKNELAKSKVEAIIQRLAILGTAQDQNAQEIQQLAHPIAEPQEESQS